jgi:hypothetical protein
MTLEHQVTNLEISKHLKELGVSQKSQFYHGASGVMFQPLLPNQYVICSAFTVAELGAKLPFLIKFENKEYSWECYKMGESTEWQSWIADSEGVMTGRFWLGDSEADARGLLLIYLLENKLLTL